MMFLNGVNYLIGFMVFLLSSNVYNVGFKVNVLMEEISIVNEIVIENCL